MSNFIYKFYYNISKYDSQIIKIIKKYCIDFYETYKRRKIVLFFRPYYLVIKRNYLKYKFLRKFINILSVILIYSFFLLNFKWVQEWSYYTLIFCVWLIPQFMRWVYTLKFAWNITLYMIFSTIVAVEIFLIDLFGDPGFYGTICGFILGMLFYDIEYFRWYFITYRYMKLWVQGNLVFLEESIYINRLFEAHSKRWQEDWYYTNWILWQYKEKHVLLKKDYKQVYDKFQNTFLQNQNLRKIIARLLNSNKDLKTEKNILQKENEFLRNVLKQIKFKNVKQPVKTK